MYETMSGRYMTGSRTYICKLILLLNDIKANDTWKEIILISGSQPTDI